MFNNWPFIFFPDVVLLGEIDQVYDGFGSDEEMLIQYLYLIIIPVSEPDRLILCLQ